MFEEEWLKIALMELALLNQPFEIGFDFDMEAVAWNLAERLRSLGFRCKTPWHPTIISPAAQGDDPEGPTFS